VPVGQQQEARTDASRSPAGFASGTADDAGEFGTRLLAESPLDFFEPLISPRWAFMSAAMLFCAFGRALLTWSLPSTLSAALIAIAVSICLFAPRVARIENEERATDRRRLRLLFIMIGLPMISYGLAMAHWSKVQVPAQINATIAILAILVLIASGLLQGRINGIVVATLSLWIGGMIGHGSQFAIALSICGGIVGTALVWVQGRDDRAEQERVVRREQRQRRAEELLREYEQTGQGWFWETDRRGQITYVSPRIARLLGRAHEELVGRAFISLFHLEAREQESERTLVFHLSTRSSFQDIAVRAATREEEERWWSITGRPVLDQYGNYLGFRGSGVDLTEARRSQRHATELARFDSLTKLANRFQMSEWLGKILNSPRPESQACAVFLLDLDRFKQVNDTMGHPAGDALLRQVADRLRTTVGSVGRVGRLGGDEFQVILPGHFVRETLAHLAQRIIENLSQPYKIDKSRVSIGASIGIALCPEDGTTSEALIRNADLALYAAKDGGRGRHHFYAEDLHSEARERQQLEEDLRDAIAQGALELHYQPQVQTTTERIAGFEALLRWNHPEHGYLSPAKFVPIAEDSGLVAAIGEWAIRTACHDLSHWPEEVRVAVNVSPLQFANPALPAIVTSAIASAGVSPSRLELEITESIFLQDTDDVDAMFAALKGVGVRLALDDFGTGYSSLGYLRKAPFDKIKIDQSFVRGATVPGSRNGAIITAIVSLAEALHMETTAEGVETLDELDLVRIHGCSHVQGYIYDRPLTPQAVVERLQNGLVANAQGPRSARPPRQAMLRRVVLEHGDQTFDATIRNISQAGAMIEGIGQVPEGTVFGIRLTPDFTLSARTRWSDEMRMGVEFDQRLDVDSGGAVQMRRPVSRQGVPLPGQLCKAG
jgi:diguanylate cyclase (GGDEF)-like protein/PAS domain S-box-containing protein